MSASDRGANFVIAVVAGAISYTLWPTGISDTPLSQLTLGGLGGAITSVCLGFGACTKAVEAFS